MTLTDYNSDRDEFLEINLRYHEGDIKKLEDHPLKETLLKLYKFGKDYIDRYSNSLGLKKTYFFFHTDESNNAFADPRHSSCNVIFIHNGLLISLYNKLFQSGINFRMIDDGKYSFLQDNLSDPLNRFMFEAGIIFTFFHEFAHLIQNKIDITFFNDELIPTNSYDQYRHIKEYDSDLQGCNFVMNFIAQYCEDHSKILKNEVEIANLHWLGLSTIIITMLLLLNRFDKGNPSRDLYIKSKDHPHEAVRIHYMLEHYSFNMKNTFGLNVDLGDALKYTFRFCYEYFYGTDIFMHYFMQISGNRQILNSYTDELDQLSEKEPKMSRHYIDKLI